MLFARKPRVISRLLVVEDEPLVAFDTEHLLGENGYTVVATVDRVRDAVAVIERSDDDGDASLDLVLVDVNLADGSGTEVARAAGAKGIPVMFVTGACPSEAEALAIGYLAKPYAQKTLLAAIEAVGKAVEGKPPKRLPPGMRLFAALA